jgi:hypothetical protein
MIMETLGSYNKPYVWNPDEITSNMNDDIGFELGLLLKDGRLTTHKEVVEVLRTTLDYWVGGRNEN